MVDVKNLAVTLSGQRVLHGVTISLQKGEIVTIVGPDGSGRSALLRAIIGAVKPSAGSITRAPGLRIGYVPQTLHIDPTRPCL